MINWIKNILSKPATAEEPEETSDEVGEKFSPVGVRVRPHPDVPLEPADTHVDGYNVDETAASVDDKHSATVNDMKTTGVDPYNAAPISKSEDEEPNSEK